MVYVGYNYKKETNKNAIIILSNSKNFLIIFLGIGWNYLFLYAALVKGAQTIPDIPLKYTLK